MEPAVWELTGSSNRYIGPSLEVKGQTTHADTIFIVKYVCIVYLHFMFAMITACSKIILKYTYGYVVNGSNATVTF